MGEQPINMWIKFGLPYFKCYYQPAGPLISPHVLPPVSTGPPPPLANVSLLPTATANATTGVPTKKQIPTPLSSDPELLHPAPPSTTSAADSTDSDVLITGGDLTPFRYPPSSVPGAPGSHHSATQQQHQLHQQAAAAAAHSGSPYPRSMHAAQMHYLTAYPPNYYSPYPGEAMCYSPPAAAYQPYFPTKVYQSGPPHPPPGAYRRYSYYPPGHPPPAELYEQAPPPPPPSGNSSASNSQQSVPQTSTGAPQASHPAPPQGPTGSQLVPAGPAAHAQHLEHYPGPPGYYSGYSPGGPSGQCYTRSLQTPYMEYPPQCPCPMQQSCPKNVSTGPHIGSNKSSINNGSNLTAMNHNNSNCMSNNNPVVNGSQNSSSSSNINLNQNTNQSTIMNSNTLMNVESNHSSCSSNNNNNMKNSVNTSRGPVNKSTNQEQQQNMETEKYANLYQQEQRQDSLRTSVKSEMKTEETDCKSQYEDHVVQPPTPPESYGTNEEKSLLIEDEVMDAAMERLEMSRIAAVKAATKPAVTLTTTIQENLTNSTTSPATVPKTIEAYDLTSPVMSTTHQNVTNNNNSHGTNGTNSSNQSLVVGRKARIGKTMAREMVYAAAATTALSTTVPTSAQQQVHQQSQQQQQKQAIQQPLIQVRTLPQQNPAVHNTNAATAASPLTVPSSMTELTTETLPLLTTIKTEIKAEHIKLEDEALEAILQHQQQQHISNSYHPNELKIKTEPMQVIDSNQNEDFLTRLRINHNEVETNSEPSRLQQTKAIDAVDGHAIPMPKPINEGRMRLLSNWQKTPKVNCEIDLSTTSDDDILDLCQSPTTSTENSSKRIKILDFQISASSAQGKKSSPSGYKNLIKQAEPKSYLCLSRRRIETRNLYAKLQRKCLTNGSANLRRRHIFLTEQQKERIKARRSKLKATSKKRAAKQIRLEEKQKTKATNSLATTNVKTEPMETEQQTEIIDLVQDYSSNESQPTSSSSLKTINSPKPKIQDSPKASPKRAPKPKKSSAIPLHLIETIDAVARGYYSEPETRCSSLLIPTFACEKEPLVSNAPKTLAKPLQVNGRKQKSKISIEKRSKSETKKPIKNSKDAQTFPALTPLTLPQTQNSVENCTKDMTIKEATKTTSIQSNAMAVNNIETITDPLEIPVLSKSKAKTSSTANKTKNQKDSKSKTKISKASQSKSKAKPKAKQNKNQQNNSTESAASTDEQQLLIFSNEKSNDTILRETNNNEIVEKSTTLVENSSQSTLEIIKPATVQSNIIDDKTLEEQNTDLTELTPVTASAQESISTKELQLPAATTAAATSHSENAQVFLQPPTLPPRILCHSHHYHGKRTRSRTKFGPRKRPRHKHSTVSYELDERLPLAPRSDVIPKWNNGWLWEGEPFQGAVFLNSDDPLVIRTCYPAMRHSEGDIIRTRDCVLLKANEDNELPYVAKVAHLWENPEDGEMMVSLLWYYRPEHTEQGRQPCDSPDEVYASRHRDHNSVACIEDKCYVLTFSEYCRYRRRLRAVEEDIEDVTSVPKPAASFYSTQKVPDNTNPELVMFCRRAYEFRTRRLLKMPNKQDYYVVND